MKELLLKFEPHIRQKAIIYVLVTYSLFVFLNESVLDWSPDVYGFAMVVIGVFYLTLMKTTILLNKLS